MTLRDTLKQLAALREKWRSGEHAESLRRIYNAGNQNYEAAGAELDGMLDCADELDATLPALMEMLSKLEGLVNDPNNTNIHWLRARINRCLEGGE